MCVVSMVMQHYYDEWDRRFVPPPVPFFPQHPEAPGFPVHPPSVPRPVTQEEIDEFRRLLDRAREYDRKHGEPDCELAEKKAALKKLAEQLGVDISFVDATA